jgi:hypothetical protein
MYIVGCVATAHELSTLSLEHENGQKTQQKRTRKPPHTQRRMAVF